MRSKINASAAKRILHIPLSRKIEFTEHGDRVVVRDKDQVHIIPIAKFNEHHEATRREGAKECTARFLQRGSFGELYEVKGTRGDLYSVELREARLWCTCEDFYHYEEDTCKHGYAVLNALGVQNLSDYLLRRSCEKLAEMSTARLHYTPAPRMIGGVTIE